VGRGPYPRSKLEERQIHSLPSWERLRNTGRDHGMAAMMALVRRAGSLLGTEPPQGELVLPDFEERWTVNVG
jgi:hypothetical protein